MRYLPIYVVLIIIAVSILTISYYRLSQNYSISSQPLTPLKPQELPFNLPPGFIMSTYFKTSSSPRVLATDNENTIFVSLPRAGKIIALINQNQGQQPRELDIITNLNYPHGIAYYNNKLFIAEENQVSRYDWNKKTFTATLEKILFTLPSGGNHTTRSIIFDSSGRMLVSIGSSCNVCVENNPWRGSIIISDFEGNNPKIFASGLRNTVFMTINSQNGSIWGTDMGRDFLGDNLPPDEINILKEGQNYGWPYCYGNQIKDKNFFSTNSFNCQNTVSPVFEISAHFAPLGLVFINSSKFPSNYQGNLLVAYHGSWNSSILKGYKVVALTVNNNQAVGEKDFITGFINNSQILGRPVGLLFNKDGDLFLSDDKSNTIYKISYVP